MMNDNRESLFSRLLGDEYEMLSRPVRALHDAPSSTVFSGTAGVSRGNRLASLVGFFVSLPSARIDAALSVTIEKTESTETWTRNFAGDEMVSTLSERNGFLSERLWPVRFDYSLSVQDGALIWTIRKVYGLGIPLPISWFHGVSAREYGKDGKYHFDVHASLPLVGKLIEYHGNLNASSND